MTDNLPATTTTATPAVPDEWAGLATFDDGLGAFIEHFGLSMPRLSTDFGKNGKGFVDTLTGEAINELRIVMLAVPPSRAFWLKSLDEGGDGGPPDCASRVNFREKRPDDDVPNRQSDTCTSCPHAQWGDRDPETGKSERPRCAESVNVLAHDQEQDRMFWVRFAGTALKPLRDYISALQARRQPFFSCVTVVTLDERRDGKLEWLAPKFLPGEKLTPAEVQPYREVAERAMQMWASVADEMAAHAAAPTDVIDTTGSYEPGPDEEPF